MRLSGGFQGRTNKLVDGCYSFWQGALFPLLHHTLTSRGKPVSNTSTTLSPREMLSSQSHLGFINGFMLPL
jgi:protein farnesyltransferase subunit beta